MRIKFSKIITSTLIMILMVSGSHADRIKGYRRCCGSSSNQLIGYGLVGGFSGTGDGRDLESQDKALPHFYPGLVSA